MNEKSYSLPLGMIFQKYHCAKCGATLEKERTHRVVTKDDPDYYRYHSFGKFPRRDCDVYEHQFKCPDCGASISFDEQCIIKGIQKQQGHTVLSSSEIKSHYAESQKRHRKQVLLQCILLPIVYALLVFGIYYIANPDRPTKDLWSVGLFLVIAAVVMAVRSIIYRKKTK
jgi:predicted RNA-binding Zn-ribbon protein involved in translation (DUF1610 family)